VDGDPDDDEEYPIPANSLFSQAMTLTEWLATSVQGQLARPQGGHNEILGRVILFSGTDAGQ